MAGIAPPRDFMRRASTACVAPPANAKVPTVFCRPATARLMAEPPVTAKTLSPHRPLLSLPLHIVAEVLSALGTVQHLPSTLLSHPIFYAAYKDFPSLVYGSLRSQIVDDEVYLLALVTYESDPARRSKFHKSTADFLSAYRDNAASIISSHQYIKLYEALRLGDFNTAIVNLREKFLERTLRKAYGIEDLKTPLPEEAKNITLGEQRRVDRALYRFQIYCNLFSHQFRNGEEEVELKRIFYDKHSSWVNEQMCCVYDFLESELQLALDQVASLSAERAEWVNGDNKHRQQQHYLSLGLAWLHQLVTASVDEQIELLEAAKDFNGSIDKIAPAIPPTPAAEQTKSFDDMFVQTGPTKEWHAKINATLSANDPDKGPELLWKDTHKTGANDVFFFVDHECSLRRLGYVMWDTKRLESEDCQGNICAARADATPTFLSPGRLMNVARSWDKQFRAGRPTGPTAGRRTGRPTPSARPAPRPSPRPSPRPAPRAAPRPSPSPLVNGGSSRVETPTTAAAASTASSSTAGPMLPMRTSTPTSAARTPTPIRPLPQILVRPPTPRTIASHKVSVG